MNALSILLLIFVLSFAIERVVRAALFLLSFIGPWSRWLVDPRMIDEPVERSKAENRQKLVYTIALGILGFVVVVAFSGVRIIEILASDKMDVNEYLDMLATGIILIGGSDFVGRLLQISGVENIGAGSTTSTQPIEITGKLTLESTSTTHVEPK